MNRVCAFVAAVFCLFGFSPGTANAADWPTFGGSPQRQGYNASEHTLGRGNVGGLKLHWSAPVGTGGALVQPAYAEHIQVDHDFKNMVFVAGVQGALTAIDADSGSVVWSRQLSALQECGGRWRGIGGTPTIDRFLSRLYVVDAAGLLHALDLATGNESRFYPIQIIDTANQAPNTWSHASVTQVGPELYISTSSMCPDTLPYHGEIISVFAPVPFVFERYFTLGTSGPSGGGVWGPGGVAVSPDWSTLYAATGNAKPPPSNIPGAESIMAMDLFLHVRAINGPIASTLGDYDFGATPLVFQGGRCPPRLAALGKSGVVVLYDPASIGAGPLQTLQVGVASGTAFLIGIPAFSPGDSAIYFQSGSDAPGGGFHHGMIALQLNAQCLLTPLWNQSPSSAMATRPYLPSPVMTANGVVWLSYANGADTQMVAYATDGGSLLWRSGGMFKPSANLSGPLAAGGQVFVSSTDGNLYAFGL